MGRLCPCGRPRSRCHRRERFLVDVGRGRRTRVVRQWLLRPHGPAEGASVAAGCGRRCLLFLNEATPRFSRSSSREVAKLIFPLQEGLGGGAPTGSPPGGPLPITLPAPCACLLPGVHVRPDLFGSRVWVVKGACVGPWRVSFRIVAVSYLGTQNTFLARRCYF